FYPATQPGNCSSPTSKVPLLAGSKMRVAEVVVERMQQFKRVAPEQLKHSTDDGLPKFVANGGFPDENIHHLPSMEHDGALALALQQETEEEALASLEDAGLFFCQICQKDLSAMNTKRREQHVNRCLDEMEEAQMSSSSKPLVPECPICGKQFQTPQSRVSHLKHCAVEMDVPPKMLLQAVQLQVSTLGEAPLQCPSNQPSRSKRKGSSKEASKKTHKRAKMETKDEDFLVAMAMSHSLLEQENCLFIWVPPPFLFKEKKRRKRGPTAPPPLLLQDPEKVRKRIQERVAMLLAEEVELPPTPQLPTSRILENESGKATWLLPLSKANECFLWNISALTGHYDPESFYTGALTPPIVPWKPVQVGYSCLCSDVCFLSLSQKDAQILQDLVDLATEGLTLTQWNIDAGHVQETEQPGEFWQPCQPCPWSLSYTELLAEDFGAMINNPHLSDVQFQVDCGKVLYAHMFVLYARCPQVIQVVSTADVLSSSEDGNAQTWRVLLSDMTAEAVSAFLRYLYAADADIPAGVLPQVHALAVRFGVRELMEKCESNTGESQVSSGVDSEDDFISMMDGKDCEDRAENFQDLLKSMWVGEDEEEVAMLNPECQKEDGVGEQELEEIYEFAATQRKMVRGETEGRKGTDCSICSDTEASQGTNQQTKEEEVKRSKSALISNSFEELRDDNDVKKSKCDSSAQEEKMQDINRCKRMNDLQTTFVPHHSEPQKWDIASHGATTNEGESVKQCEGVKDNKSSQVSHDEADHCENQLPSFHNDTNRNESYEHLFSQGTQRSYCEPSPLKEVIKESGKAPSEKRVDESFLYSKSQKDLSPHRNSFCGSPLPKHYVPLFPAVGSSPASPKLERRFASERVSTPKQNKEEKSFPSDKISFQKASELDTASRNKSIISPAKLPHIDLNKDTYVPVLSSLVIKTQDAAAQGNKEGDVIVLSSDDEMELQQDKKSPESGSALKKMEISGRQVDACMESKRSPNLSPEKSLHHEMSSGTDSSWLVPDTPVLSKSRSFSTHTQVTGINSLKSPGSKLSTKNFTAGNSNHEMTGNSIKVHETTLSDIHLPMKNRVSERSPPSSPTVESFSMNSPQVSPEDPVLLSPGHTDIKSKCAKISSLSKPVPQCNEQSLEDKTNTSVVEVEDNEKEISLPSLSSSVLLCDEPPIPTDDCWHVEYVSPVRGNSQDSSRVRHAKTSTTSSPRADSWHEQWESPAHVQEIKGSTPLQGSPVGRTTLFCLEKSPIEAWSSVGNRASYLNSKIWDVWNGEDKEDEFPEMLPLSQRLSAAARAHQADAVKTPGESLTQVTPMPAYSMMETPQLKKELSRFGVRALPKRQMVLKLKEIFQYTHKDVDSDFEDEIPSSQPPLQKTPCASASRTVEQKKSSEPISFMNGFEACAFQSEEDEEEFTASQAAAREEEKMEAVRCYIRSNTALYNKILFYEPIELADLHTELKQNGIKISKAKLLDFLDAHCITFTTAGARKEMEKKKGEKRRRRRY
uniref:Structure-specific endonuclease subunit SLX4 n=1 Tax=Amazona collaria TaxID=241587 RepID=A0A8B9GKK2_9PSIT